MKLGIITGMLIGISIILGCILRLVIDIRSDVSETKQKIEVLTTNAPTA